MPPSDQRSIRFWGMLGRTKVTVGVFKRHRLGLESLEPRLAMCSAHESTNSAGELTSPSAGSCSAVVSPAVTSVASSGKTLPGDVGTATGTAVAFGPVAAPGAMQGLTSSTNGGPVAGRSVNTAGEGETQPLATDLMALARAISASGTKFYGAAWCTFCTQQKELFADAQYYLPFVEATNPDRTLNEVGTAAGITSFPTWVFPDGSRETGVQTLATLAARSGVSVTTSNAPELLPFTDQWIYAGSPQWIALDGFDPNFDALTYTVTSDNPSLLTTQVSQANRSLVVDVKSWGKMTFQLFDNIVPRITERIVGQAEIGFYDKTSTNNSIVSQVVKDAKQSFFRLGDPAGNGTSVSGLGPIADQFDVRLQHNSAGLLSLAKTADDTGDVQFFVLGEPVRQFDFQYPIFGMLTEGEKVRRAINLTATNNGKPTADIVVNSIDVVRDGENALLMLSAADGKFGEANVTVTVRDPGGRSAQRTFKVTVLPDPTNSGPFLSETRSVMTSPGVAVSLQLNAVDADGDPVRFEASLEDPTKGQINVNATTGQLTVTPVAGFTGDLRVKVGVRAPPDYPNDTFDPVDTQTLIIKVRANPTYWQNLDLPADVDQDGVVVPRDALLVINELNARALSTSSGAMKFERPTATTGFFYFDTSGDNLVTPVDALRVVNRLNGIFQPGEGEAASVIESSGEGELVSAVEDPRSVDAGGVFVAGGAIEPVTASRIERAMGIAGGDYCVRDDSPSGGPPVLGATSAADSNGVAELDVGIIFDAIFSDIGKID